MSGSKKTVSTHGLVGYSLRLVPTRLCPTTLGAQYSSTEQRRQDVGGGGGSVAQLRPTLRKPTDCSTPGLSVLHCLPEFAQTHVH